MKADHYRRDVLLTGGCLFGTVLLPTASATQQPTGNGEPDDSLPDADRVPRTDRVRRGDAASADDLVPADEPLFEEDFETVSAGDVPSAFVLAGNTDQEVTDEMATDGDQSYRMDGMHGSCWRALARTSLDVGEAIRISGSFRLGDGEEGCHTGSGSIHLQTETGTAWEDGSATELLQFHPDGTVESHGTVVGEYVPGEWSHFEVDYLRDTGSARVTYRCRIGDGDVTSVMRDEDEDEDALSALELRSDDFTVFWDELSVVRLEPDAGEGDEEDTADDADPGVDVEDENGVPWLWLLGGGGVLGTLYYARRRGTQRR